MNKALWKDNFRQIKNSLGRFIAVMAIICLGVAFFIGIKATGPSMIETARKYYEEANLPDGQLLSSYGLNEDDQNAVESSEDDWLWLKSITASVRPSEELAHVYTYNPNDKSIFHVKEGRLPENKGEIALDTKFLDKSLSKGKFEFKIGDKINLRQINEPDVGDDLAPALVEDKFTLVGFVETPLYFERYKRDGVESVYAVVSDQSIEGELYTEAFYWNKEARNHKAYSDEYNKSANLSYERIEASLKTRPQERLDELKEEINQQIKNGEEEISDARKKLKDGEAELNEAKEKLDQAKKEIESGQAELASSKEELENGQAEYNAGYSQYESGLNQLNDARDQYNQLVDQENTQEENRQLLEDNLSQLRAKTESLNQQIELLQSTEIPSQAADEMGAEEISEPTTANSEELNQLLASKAEIDSQIESLQTELDQINQLTQARIELGAQIDSSQAELESSYQQLLAAEGELEVGRLRLANGENELSQAQEDYEKGLNDYETARAEYSAEKEKAEKEIADGESDLDKARQELDTLKKPTYLLKNRQDFVGYQGLYDNAKQLDVISNIFPVLFLAIAVLVVSTTITRMVSEERNYMGTMLQMGYGSGSILSKFGLYAGVSSAVGAIIGVYLGYLIFPPVIISTYNNLYYLDDIQIVRSWKWELIACLIGFLCALLPALLKPAKALNTAPANLLRPEPPRSGQKILLERWTSLWSRISFKAKMTIRNLMRYKGRNLMTMLGVAGCSMLIVTGFGISDTVTGFMDVQFDEIQKFDSMIVLEDDLSDSELESVRQKITKDPLVQDLTAVYSEQLEYTSQEGGRESITLVAFCDPFEKWSKLVGLWERGNPDKLINPENSGPIVTELFMENENIEAGSVYTFTDGDYHDYSVSLNSIAENYTNHYLYMTVDQYEEITGQKLQANNLYVSFKDGDQSKFNQMITEDDRIVTAIDIESTAQSAKNTMNNLRVITIVLLIAAVSLAFVVLYNLTNINIGERIRELSTIKVLGFYDLEVSMYIYREILVLTIIGAVVGLVLGKYLTYFIMKTMQMKDLLFYPVVKPHSYIFALLITIVFSVIVMAFMHVKLKRIDMVEALKAVE